jgi:iron(III) transport system substrate-binding protein
VSAPRDQGAFGRHLLITIVLVGCSSDAQSQSKALTLYTCANDAVEQAVVKAYEQGHSGSKVDVFRAPTGQLNARVAADVRGGGIRPTSSGHATR